ncbi:hypothetical protein V5799_020230 [Amblyomma americanum]|uniref:Uncharacterized protein n=1 Tax=Amblyomma americanum TaxID=6943 RepID=A0AAQ4EUN2_AMBAM
MADPEWRAEEAASPPDPDPEQAVPKSLAKLENAKGCFSGADIDYRCPCTATQYNTCQISRKLPLWNEFLIHIRLHLSFLPGRSGNLCLTPIPGDHLSLHELEQPQTHRASTLLYWLLRNHHCVTFVQVHPLALSIHAHIFANALHSNTSVKVLKLHFSHYCMPESVCTAIPTLKNLEELEFKSNGMCPPNMAPVLSRLVRTTASLVSLNTSEALLDNHEGEVAFFTALAANSTLRELSVRYRPRTDAYRRALCHYLESTATLTTLKIVAVLEMNTQSWLSSVLEGIVANKTLSSLTLKYFRIDREFAQYLANIILGNKVLRILHIDSFSGISQSQPLNVCDCCLEAVIGNEILEELSLPVQFWQPERWELLFKELPRKVMLQKVTVQSYMWDREPLRHVCKVLSGSGAEEKVHLGTYYHDGNRSGWECRGFSEVWFFNRNLRSFERSTLQRLTSLSHIRTVCFTLSGDDFSLAPIIADYIRETLTLRVLKLFASPNDSDPNVPNTWWSVILESLSANRSISELIVTVTNVNLEDVEGLADAVMLSAHIRRLDMCLRIPTGPSAFVRRLSANIDANYTITGVILRAGVRPTKDWFSVLNAVRRNSDLVTRATLFATATICDK